jgi:iron(III) transport system permease protein
MAQNYSTVKKKFSILSPLLSLRAQRSMGFGNQTLAILLSVLLLTFIWWPLYAVLKTTVLVDGVFSLQHYRDAAEFLKTPLMNSLVLALTVASVGTFVGFILAYLIWYYPFKLKGVFKTLGSLSMISPPFMLALSLIMLLGKQGLITQKILIPYFNFTPTIYGFSGLFFVETLSYFPTAFLLLTAAFDNIDGVLIEASRSQGATTRQTFFKVLLPLVMPTSMTAFLLIFIESLADFGNPLILAGNFKVLAVESYLKITGEFDTASGAILALALLLPSLLAFALQRYIAQNRSFATKTGKPSQSHMKSKTPLSAYVTVLFLLTPTVLMFSSVIFGAFVHTWGAQNTFTTAHFSTAFQEARFAFTDSMIISVFATFVSVLAGFICAYLLIRTKILGKTFIEASSLLTFAVPGTVIGIGYILAFNDKPLLLTGSLWIILAVLVFRNLPISLQAISNNIRQIDPQIEESAQSLGAPQNKILRSIVLPLTAPSIFSGLAYSFVRSITAISAVIFVVSGSWNLITVNILGFVESSQLSKASAMCLMLVAVALLTLSLMKLITFGDRHDRTA